MALSIGIVGLPNVGKSTVFNALTKAQNAQAVNYPFSTIEPNKATVPVPDARLQAISDLVKPRKTMHTTVDFIDISGLVQGASKGEGLGNQFLANIRECSAIIEVIRCFEDNNITHVGGDIAPLRDIDVIETELLLADIQTVSKRIERLQKLAKCDKNIRPTLELCNALFAHLDDGNIAATFPDRDLDTFAATWHELSLLTAKKILYCANIDENALQEPNEHMRVLQAFATEHDRELVYICARLEEELQSLEDAEQTELLASYGIEQSGLVQVIQRGYALLDLISYFTAGEKEVRAWTIQRGFKAPKAASVIHSDFERGFIRAEVIAYDAFIKHGSEAACRVAGVLRKEGKEYIVNDGDVMHFLFNV